MLSSIISGGKSVFDRRALVSAFLPAVVFWGAAVAVVLGVRLGWHRTIDEWKALDGTAQGVLIAAFFLSAGFWAFLTIGLRVRTTQWLEGYGPDTGPGGAVRRWLRNRQEARFDALLRRDLRLEEQQLEVRDALGKEPAPADFKALTDEEARLAASRLDVHNVLAALPSDRARLLPTRLGNMLRGAESYGQERYGVDAVLIWPRLSPLLPAGAASAEADAGTVLDLMVTLTVSGLLFGVPIAAGLGAVSAHPVSWVAPAALLALALLLRTLPASLAALLALLCHPPFVDVGWADSRAAVGAQVALSVLAGALVFSAVCYRGALEAAATLGEHVRAAVDLYRWSVLDALHLRRPADLEAERRLWQDVAGLIHRGYEPESGLYRYAQTADEEPVATDRPSVRLPLPVRAVSAWRPLEPADLVEQDVPQDAIDEPCATTSAELIDTVPLTALPAGRPVPRRLLVSAAEFAALTAVSLALPDAGALAGLLRPGDRVDVSAAEETGAPSIEAVVLGYAAPDGSGERGASLAVAVPRDRSAALAAAGKQGTAIVTVPLGRDRPSAGGAP
jgi:hypothetical protein